MKAGQKIREPDLSGSLVCDSNDGCAGDLNI